MKKKWWINLIIVLAVVALCLWATYFLHIKQDWKHETVVSECQDFIDECCKRVWSFRAWGWHVIFTYEDWRTNIDDRCDEACPKDCSRYTEKRWYFEDKEKQQEYYDNKVKECNKEYNECTRKSDRVFWECHTCDEYWQARYYWN